MSNTNEMTVEFKAIGENEGFARIVITAFIAQLNPTLEEMGDVKVAVSEAVTNAIIHGYEKTEGMVQIRASIKDREIRIQIQDWGKGIRNIEQAMEPLFTTKPEEERSGMGFSFMEAFMDNLEVESQEGVGTTITMVKMMGEEHGPNN